MCWVGAKEPGGAFQGGTILAAMWLLVMIAGLRSVPSIGQPWLRLLLVVGPVIFLAIGIAGIVLANAFLAYPAGYAKPLIVAVEFALTLSIGVALGLLAAGPAGTGATAMNAATLFGLCGAALVGVGLYGLVTNPEPLRKILAFNLLGSGVFLVFGVVARRAAAAGSRRRSRPSGDGHYRDRRCLRGNGHGDRTGAAAFAGNRPIHAQRRQSRRHRREKATPDAGRKRLARRDNDRWSVSLFWRSYCRPRASCCRSSLGGRYAERIAAVLLPSGLVLASIIFVDVWRSGHRLVYIVGDWKPPLGIALRADGLSAAMMVAMAIVICAVAHLCARGFRHACGVRSRPAHRSRSGSC